MLHNWARAKNKAVSFLIENASLPFRRVALARLGMRPAEALAISAAAACTDSYALEQKSPFLVVSPSFAGCSEKWHDGVFDALLAYSLNDVSCSAYSPAIVGREEVFLPAQVIESGQRVSVPGNGLFRQAGNSVCIVSGTGPDVERGIHIGGAGAFNWYHFVIECLPKAFLAQSLPSEFDDFPLILPEECLNIPSFSDALKTVSGGRALRCLSRKQIARFRRLLVLDEVSYGPFNLRGGEWPRVSDYCQHDEALKAFLSTFRNGILSNRVSARRDRRIFLARPAGRRKYNQAELIEIAEHYGFEAVFPEQMTLQAQAQLFSEADLVVGPSGAAWVGMVFGLGPIRGLSWLPAVYREFSSYSTLAHLLGHRLFFIEAKPEHELRTTGAAYVTNYTVCSREFEMALQNLVEGTPS